jgi:hypothetical protein
MMKIKNPIIPLAGFGTNAVSTRNPRKWGIVDVVLSVFLGFLF